jgi:hypothetical protein
MFVFDIGPQQNSNIPKKYINIVNNLFTPMKTKRFEINPHLWHNDDGRDVRKYRLDITPSFGGH